ncbi:hypothetical protein [Embleya sp. NPDC001921]
MAKIVLPSAAAGLPQWFRDQKSAARTRGHRAEDSRVAQQPAAGGEALSRLIIIGETVDGVLTESGGGRQTWPSRPGSFPHLGRPGVPLAPADLGECRGFFAVAPPLLFDNISV